MFTLDAFDAALQQFWTSIYAKVMAIVLCYGATVHVANMVGLTGTPWLQTPLLWRGMDVALLLFDMTAAIALWRGLGWSVWLVFGGIILLQFVPYTLLRSHFILKPEDAQVLNGLLGTEAILLGIFALLLWLKRCPLLSGAIGLGHHPRRRSESGAWRGWHDSPPCFFWQRYMNMETAHLIRSGLPHVVSCRH